MDTVAFFIHVVIISREDFTLTLALSLKRRGNNSLLPSGEKVRMRGEFFSFAGVSLSLTHRSFFSRHLPRNTNAPSHYMGRS